MNRAFYFFITLFVGLGVLEHNFSMLAESPLKYLSLQHYQEQLINYEYAITLFYLFLGTGLWFGLYAKTKWRAKMYLEFTSRIGLGLMFIGASLFKIEDPEMFAMLVAQYQFLPSSLVNLFSLTLPPLELIVGVLLMIGPKTKYNATLILGMMVMFIIALSQALWRDLGITCGCFEITGAQDKAGAWSSLIRDLILMPPILFLVFRDRQCWIWDFKTRTGAPNARD